MQAYQREFIRFAIERGVLRFGEFTLKSGRTSPYFFNAGLFNSGLALAQLGRFYAEAVQASGIDFDVLFGPAYKGIPLASATAIALAEQHGRDLPWCFNRKEAKEHGDGLAIVEESGVEEVRALASRLELESAEAQRLARHRELDESSLVLLHGRALGMMRVRMISPRPPNEK